MQSPTVEAFQAILKMTLDQIETLDNGDEMAFKKLVLAGLDNKLMPKAKKCKLAFLACCAALRVDEFLENGRMLGNDLEENQYESKQEVKSALKQDRYINCIERNFTRLNLQHIGIATNNGVDIDIKHGDLICGIEVCASVASKSEIQRNVDKFLKDQYPNQILFHGLTIPKSQGDVRTDGFTTYIKEKKHQIDFIEFRHSADFLDKTFQIRFFDEKDPIYVKVATRKKIPLFELFVETAKEYTKQKEQITVLRAKLGEKDQICNEVVRVERAKHQNEMDELRVNIRKLEYAYMEEIERVKQKLMESGPRKPEEPEIRTRGKSLARNMLTPATEVARENEAPRMTDKGPSRGPSFDKESREGRPFARNPVVRDVRRDSGSNDPVARDGRDSNGTSRTRARSPPPRSRSEKDIPPPKDRKMH